MAECLRSVELIDVEKLERYFPRTGDREVLNPIQCDGIEPENFRNGCR